MDSYPEGRNTVVEGHSTAMLLSLWQPPAHRAGRVTALESKGPSAR